jgi:hypothetical protein
VQSCLLSNLITRVAHALAARYKLLIVNILAILNYYTYSSIITYNFIKLLLSSYYATIANNNSSKSKPFSIKTKPLEIS